MYTVEWLISFCYWFNSRYLIFNLLLYLNLISFVLDACTVCIWRVFCSLTLRSFITSSERVVRLPREPAAEAMFKHRARSLWSPHPPLPLGFFWFLLFLGATLVTLSSVGNRNDLALTRISWTFFTTLVASHSFFLWWTPLFKNREKLNNIFWKI